MRLVCLGLGYSARHYLARFGARYDRVVGTRRTPATLTARSRGGRPIEVFAFDGRNPSEAFVAAVDNAHALLVSAPPGETGDPVLEALSSVVARASGLATIVYLSSVGVYGDHDGRFVDETTQPRPGAGRGKARLAAEMAWQALGQRSGKPVAVLRLAGIYGPGRNALCKLASGQARQIIKPGQQFNRIHVADIAQAIEAAVDRRAGGLFNVADDEPGPSEEVIAFAARLLGCNPPVAVSFAQAQATMSPMALSFYDANRRVCNAKLKRALGVTLGYPTYREGLRALFAAGDWNSLEPRPIDRD